MSDEIIKILDDLGERLGVVIDWTSENVIPMLEVLYEKFITYSLVMSIVTEILGVLLIILASKMLKYFIKCYKNCNDTLTDNLLVERCCGNQPTGLGICCIFAIAIMGSLGGALFLCELPNLIKLLTIPELYVFEYLKAYL